MNTAPSEVTAAGEICLRHKPTMVGSLRPRLGSGLLSGGAWSFVVATAGVNGFNFLFHVVISRLLGPSHYGALGALLNFISVLAVPLGAVQLAVTQAVVERADGGSSSIRSLTWRASVGGLVAMFAFWAISPLLGAFLNLGSTASLIVLGAWIPLAVVGAVLQGALMGELRFVPVAVATFVGGGALRLAAGAALVLLGFGLVGAVAATLVGKAFTSFVLVLLGRRALKRCSKQRSLRLSLHDAVLSIFALAGYTALTGIDTLLAQHFLPGKQAGIYAAGAIAGHIAMFLPGALVMVAFPRLASGGASGSESRRILIEALAFVSLLSTLAILLLAGFPSLVATTLFGTRYAQAASLIGILALESGFLGLVGLLTYVQIAWRSVRSLISWVGVGIVAILVASLRGGVDTIAVSVTVTTILIFVAIALPTLASIIRSDRREAQQRRRVLNLPREELDLTLVVPFYNPGDRLAAHVSAVVASLASEDITFEVIAVDDGCTDGSAAALADLEKVALLRLAGNQGKGAALRTGLARGRGRYLGFIDGDGDIPAHQLGSFVSTIRSAAPDIIIGSKVHRDSIVIYPHVRRAYSLVYQQINRVLFHLPTRDTQTGIKLMSREVIAAVLPEMMEERFAFDLEMLVLAQHLGFDSIIELPVEITHRFCSTISVSAVFRTLAETLGIFYRLRVLRAYTPAAGSESEMARATTSTSHWDPSALSGVTVVSWTEQ